jgi:small subunit ribosomal protein S8
MFNDTIAEYLTKIRNACGAKQRFVDVKNTKMLKQISEVLQNRGFIEKFLVDDEGHRMRVFLKYNKNRYPIIHGLRRVSSSGRRKYLGYQDLPRIYSGIGVAIVSTSKGILDDETARKNKVGGELLCTIW